MRKLTFRYHENRLELSSRELTLQFLHLVLILKKFCSAFANNDAGSHGAASCQAWHDRAIRNTKVVDSIDPEIAINYRHSVTAHLGGAGIMPIGYDAIADKIRKFCVLQISWHHLPFGERTKCGRVAYLSAEFYAGCRRLQIVRVPQIICLDLNGIEGIGPSQTNTSSALRLYDATEQCPSTRRQTKPCCVLGARL